MMAAMTMPGGSNSPESQRVAARSVVPAIAAKCAAVLNGHNTLATAPNLRTTILSLPSGGGRNCPSISLATTSGFPNAERMETGPTNTHATNTNKSASLFVFFLAFLYRAQHGEQRLRIAKQDCALYFGLVWCAGWLDHCRASFANGRLRHCGMSSSELDEAARAEFTASSPSPGGCRAELLPAADWVAGAGTLAS